MSIMQFVLSSIFAKFSEQIVRRTGTQVAYEFYAKAAEKTVNALIGLTLALLLFVLFIAGFLLAFIEVLGQIDRQGSVSANAMLVGSGTLATVCLLAAISIVWYVKQRLLDRDQDFIENDSTESTDSSKAPWRAISDEFIRETRQLLGSKARR